ncbi:hypothetical protein CRYUN_Cryun24cG0059100 [Craigia yunnanensis]
MLASMFRVHGLKAHNIILEPKESGALTPHALFLSYYLQGGKAMDPEVYPRPTGWHAEVGSHEQLRSMACAWGRHEGSWQHGALEAE